MQTRFTILFPFLFLSIVCFSQKTSKSKKLPPGTVRVNDTLFIDQTEVLNIHWREYLAYLEQIEKSEAAYQKALPDTLVWLKDSMANYYFNYYFRHPSSNNYPVVGVSHQQAVEFCKWRTYAANQADYLRKNRIKDFKAHIKDSFPISYYYRLPTKHEWELAARGTFDTLGSQYGDVEIRFPNRCCYFNTQGYYDHINKGHSEHDMRTEFRILVSKVLFPNNYGLYSYIGNVAEMISEKGIAKGGSFIHPLDSCKINMNQHYDQPERWLGFRCVAVMIK
jgi:formylglycine-generating enzyme required for sulfatase activity